MKRKSSLEVLHILIKNNLFLFFVFLIVTFVGMRCISYFNTKYVSDGDELHSGFTVVIFNNKNNTFLFSNLSDAFKYKGKDVTFIASVKEGKTQENDENKFFYHVIDQKKDQQVIEVKVDDGDRVSWYMYIATKENITPIKSRISSFDFMFGAIGFSFPFVIFLKLLSNIIGRFYTNANSSKSKSLRD